MRYLYIVRSQVAVVEKQKCVNFAMLSNYKLFRTAPKNTNAPKSLYNVLYIYVRF